MVTLKDIAKLANVSTATVSLVVNEKSGVGDAKRLEILNLLKENNYPLKKDKSKKKHHFSLLFLKYVKSGLLVDENPGFVTSILDTVEYECRKRNSILRIEVCQKNLKSALDNVDFSILDGVFFLGTELENESYHLLEKIPVPYVVIDSRVENFKCNAVTMNNHEMIYELLQYLKLMGLKRIAYFKSSIQTQNFQDRSTAFYKYSQKLGLACDGNDVFELEPTILGSYHGMNQILNQNPEIILPSCSLADNDAIAIGVIKSLKKHGYQIPQDLSIVGFDDIHFSSINSPTLTTMQVRTDIIGKLAVQALINSIKHPEINGYKQLVGGDLIIRESVFKKE